MKKNVIFLISIFLCTLSFAQKHPPVEKRCVYSIKIPDTVRLIPAKFQIKRSFFGIGKKEYIQRLKFFEENAIALIQRFTSDMSVGETIPLYNNSYMIDQIFFEKKKKNIIEILVFIEGKRLFYDLLSVRYYQMVINQKDGATQYTLFSVPRKRQYISK